MNRWRKTPLLGYTSTRTTLDFESALREYVVDANFTMGLLQKVLISSDARVGLNIAKLFVVILIVQ